MSAETQNYDYVSHFFNVIMPIKWGEMGIPYTKLSFALEAVRHDFSKIYLRESKSWFLHQGFL